MKLWDPFLKINENLENLQDILRRLEKTSTDVGQHVASDNCTILKMSCSIYLLSWFNLDIFVVYYMLLHINNQSLSLIFFCSKEKKNTMWQCTQISSSTIRFILESKWNKFHGKWSTTKLIVFNPLYKRWTQVWSVGCFYLILRTFVWY